MYYVVARRKAVMAAPVSVRLVRQTTSRIAEDELMAIRRQIALAIGLE
jgi:hypothetical protein